MEEDLLNKIIHHVWPGEDEFKYKDFRQTWTRTHPDWTFFFWRINNLPFDRMLDCVKEVINNPDISIVMKSDIIRWEVVRIFGGIYVDTDMECVKPFNEFLKHKSFCGKAGDCACNALFGSDPDDKLIKVSETLCANIKNNYSIKDTYYGVISLTGPGATRDYLEKMEVVYDENYFYKSNKNAYSVHHWTNSNEGGWTWLLKDKKLKELDSKCLYTTSY